MNEALMYEGLAFVSFDDQAGPPSLDLIEVRVIQIGILTFQLHCSRQQAGRRVIITPAGQPSIQGNITAQESGVTTFVGRTY